MITGTITSDTMWTGPVAEQDDFGDKISNVIIDGRTKFGGSWALMTPKSWAENNNTDGRFGTGLGQMYVRTNENRWIKIEG